MPCLLPTLPSSAPAPSSWPVSDPSQSLSWGKSYAQKEPPPQSSRAVWKWEQGQTPELEVTSPTVARSPWPQWLPYGR